MEPKQFGPGGGLERPSAQAGEAGSLSPDQLGFAPDNEQAHEKAPEVGAVQAEAAQLAMPTLPVPVIAASDDTAVITTNVPQTLTADDSDLIEKEWVDKAKKILAETKDDPYRREQEISRLQTEYILKRYGRVIGSSGD